MKRCLAFLFVACGLSFNTALLYSQVQATAPLSDARVTKPINESVKALIDSKKLAGAVTLVAYDGELIHLQAHGQQSLESKVPMNVDTLFRIHSMTKAIVSAAALRLREEGKLNLADPVSEYLPEYANSQIHHEQGTAPAKNSIRVMDLFLHTSGLAYGFTAPPELKEAYGKEKLWAGDLTQFSKNAAKLPLMHEPNQGWTYGIGTDVLGRVIEVCSGKDLDVYLQEMVFDPMGMKDTQFWIRNSQDQKRFASVHKLGENGVESGADPLNQVYLKKPQMISGGGGLVSTANDYYQFLRAIANDGKHPNGYQLLKPSSVELMTTNQLPDEIPNIYFGDEQRTHIGFGCGFSVVKRDTDFGAFKSSPAGEYGWGGAASCHYWVSPKDKNLIVITLEQTNPYNWNMEDTLKPVIYRAIRK
ncbi:MAG: serine hydrolase domain-containing protein [Verrucomicrobiota bacterium]